MHRIVIPSETHTHARKKRRMGTRKRSAAFLLEKPLVSRLRFDRELAECERHFPSEKQRHISVESSSVESISENHRCRSVSLQVSADGSKVFLAHAEKKTKLGAAAEEDGAGRDPGETEWCPWDVPREKRNGEEVLGETTADGDAEAWSAIWGRAGPSLLGHIRDDQSPSQAGDRRDKTSEKETEKEVEAGDPGKLSLAIWSPKPVQLLRVSAGTGCGATTFGVIPRKRR